MLGSMIILEGTDAVGKTTTIELLKEYDIQDRDKYISQYMDIDISLQSRAKLYYDYINKHDNVILFLVNMDRGELERRVSLRNNIDKYDRFTYLYNILYLETYLYMEANNMLCNKLYLVDVTGLTIKKQTSKIKTIIDNLNK